MKDTVPYTQNTRLMLIQDQPKYFTTKQFAISPTRISAIMKIMLQYKICKISKFLLHCPIFNQSETVYSIKMLLELVLEEEVHRNSPVFLDDFGIISLVNNWSQLAP